MPVAITRQHSTSIQSSKRPENPIKRASSARLTRSGRSPSPFSPNTSHNEMPLPPSPDADSTSILKPAQPVRRRSARLSTATNLSNGTANGTTVPSSLKNSISANGNGFKPEFKPLDEVLADETAMQSQAVPNGSALDGAPSPLAAKHEETAESTQPDATVAPSSVIVPMEVSPLTPPKPAVKPKIDWEIPRKALHSSIGQ
jgi:hypothetical protein